jgi:hypothetical protein
MHYSTKKLITVTAKTLFVLCLVVSLTTNTYAQSERYMGAMQKNLSLMESSFKNPVDLLSLANNFERVATAEKTQWLPYYYAAFCQINLGFMEQDKDKVDAIADKANALIEKADSLSPNNSEISCIKSMIATCHMLVNPMQRWQQYGAASNSNIDAAIKQNASNPRPYYLRGQSLKNTPENFGGGCKTAKPILEQALEKYNAFKPANELEPSWGKPQLEQVLATCK